MNSGKPKHTSDKKAQQNNTIGKKQSADTKPFEETSENDAECPNLNVLSTSQSDFGVKKQIVFDDKETKSLNAAGSQPSKRRENNRKKRTSGSRSSSDGREENILIRQFVT